MARSRHADRIRSHRPGGGRRPQLVVAPWITASVIAAVVLASVTVGYVMLALSGCSGQVRATIVAAPEISRVLDNLGRQWLRTEPAVEGTCAQVKVVSQDSAAVALALGPDWDPRRTGPRPDVWVPESTTWLQLASLDREAAEMIPDLQPNLARSPVVIAMPAPMAQALGWPERSLSWQDLADDLATSEWADHGHSEWGSFTLGLADPGAATASLHALMAVADPDDNGEITSEESSAIGALAERTRAYAADTDTLLGELITRGAEGQEEVLSYVSAFPALERDVIDYNSSNPRVPLAAFYPSDGTADADFPYLILQAPWSTAEKLEVAQLFLDYVRSEQGTQAFLNAGFRDFERQPGTEMTDENGVRARLDVYPRAALAPELVSATLASWIGATRSINVLLAVDTSESMNTPLVGTDTPRLELASAAARTAVELLGGRAQVGVWSFASGHGEGDTDYRELASLGPLNAEGDDGLTRRDRILSRLDDLEGEGDGEVYDTVLAAYTTLQENYVPDALNLVIILTGGEHTDGAGLGAQELIQQLEAAADPEQPVRIITVGYGAGGQAETLERISATTGGCFYDAQYASEITSVFVDAALRR